MSSNLPTSTIPIFTSVLGYRTWRKQAFTNGQSVGYVATMGALHEGHLSLVRRSLAENDLTVVSIFVNPAQFAPHEDLATYPRTLPQDLSLLEAENSNSSRTVSAVFLPTVSEMYPSGIVQNVAEQKGTFVEVKGYAHQMEGASRPTFFRGVATVVTKLFNVIQPTNTYFGQKDIQQALLLKRLCRDLLLAHPEPDKLHIVVTARDPCDGLALSSRNAYLSADGRRFAPTLYSGLKIAEEGWKLGWTKKQCVTKAVEDVEKKRANAYLEGLKVDVKLDYLEMNDASTFEVVGDDVQRDDLGVVILSGALIVDSTRLIDNVIV